MSRAIVITRQLNVTTDNIDTINTFVKFILLDNMHFNN